MEGKSCKGSICTPSNTMIYTNFTDFKEIVLQPSPRIPLKNPPHESIPQDYDDYQAITLPRLLMQ
ncbi:hypothetical protein CHS0354_010017, partial [Potamilus streckersoni]